MRRVAVAGVWHETNTYATRPAQQEDFARLELLSGDALAGRNRGARSVVAGFLAASGLDSLPVFSARAWPCGPATREVVHHLLDRLHAELSAAAPLDGVLLNLHGSMVGEGHPDVERDVLDRVRDVVGDAPVAAVLDLHGNPSPELVARCDVVLAYDTYPHVDMYERGVEAAALLGEVLAGRALTTVIGKLPLLSCPLAQATDAEPMLGLQARAAERGRRAGLARVSLLPGFPYSDVERAGFSVLAVADRRDEAAARGVVAATLADVEAHAAAFAVVREDAPTAVRRALASERRPVVLADVADNIGGGSPGDGTVLLAELLAQGARGAVVTLADREVARRAAAAGPGATLTAEVGGKTDDRHGRPVPVEGRVLTVTDGRYRTAGSWETGQEFCMGVTAVLAVDGVTLVVTERATPPFHAEQLTSVGVDPAAASVLAAKGAVAWRAAFGAVAGEVIEVATPGVCPVDLATLPRTTVPMRLRPGGGSES